MMEDPLAALVTATRSPASWDTAVEDLTWAIAELLPDSTMPKRTSERRLVPDILVGAPGVVTLTAQVVAGENADILARTATLRDDARRLREEYPAARLSLLIVVIGPDDDLPAALTALAADFDAVVLGSAGALETLGSSRAPETPGSSGDRGTPSLAEARETWTRLLPGGAAPAPVADFAAAVRNLAADPVVAPARTRDRSRPRFLLPAGEGGAGMGGISTFNREFAYALAGRGVEVHVVLPRVDPAEAQAARERHVHLVAPDPVPGIEGIDLLLARPRFDEDTYYPHVVVGHGRVLGPYAFGLQQQFFPRAGRLHLLHMDPERLEKAKATTLDAAARRDLAARRGRIESRLARSAGLTAGVGPLLTRTLERYLAGGGVPPLNLLPGLRDWKGVVNPDRPPSERRVLLVARAEDAQSKGIHLAVRALRRATELLGGAVDQRPVLIIRGLPPDTPEPEKEEIEKAAGPAVEEVIYQDYSPDQEELRAELWQARLVIMPSLHEGFGLAAYEAIAAGVPVLITQESGLAWMLKTVAPDEERGWPRCVLPVRGGEEIMQAWATEIADALETPQEAFTRAAELRSRIMSRVTWSGSVDLLLERLREVGCLRL
jgi:D-inositol-3-phosphate glycosyltransferase